MNGQIVWDAAVIGWRRLAQQPSAEGVFTWEQHDDADCFWWTGRPGKIAHQLFLSAPSSEAMTHSIRLALNSPTRQPDCDLASRPPSPASGFTTAIISAAEERARLLRMVGGVYDDPDGLTGFFHGTGAADIVGAFDGDNLVASATVITAGETANLWSVATAQEERGRGAASAVVAAALDYAATTGCSQAGLGTSDDLAPWYTRFGFTEVGRERSAIVKAEEADHA
jgi:GNAT superfamily N-acetyltransferase